MSVELTTKYAPQTDELFKAESKIGLLTNTDFDWTGAHAIKLYKISTTPLNDYSRNRSAAPEDTESLSRYGQLLDLSATTEELLLQHDRSFIFNALIRTKRRASWKQAPRWPVNCARWLSPRWTPTSTGS